MTRPIFWLAFSFCFGIAFGRSFRGLPPAAALLSGLLWLWLAERRIAALRFFWLPLCASLCLCGAALVSFQIPPPLHFGDGPLLMAGRIDSYPVKVRSASGPPKAEFRFRASYLFRDPRWEPVDVSFQVKLPMPDPWLRRGDFILISGEPFFPEPPGNPGGFDTVRYCENKRLAGFLSLRDPWDCMRVRAAPVFSLAGFLESFQFRIKESVDGAVVFPASAIIKAVLLGDQEDIQPWMRDIFSRSGAAHLLAISGGNIAILAVILKALLAVLRVPRRSAWASVIILLWAYCFLSGCQPSIVRATIMITFTLSGILIGRESEWLTSLAWSAILILLWDPLQFFDLGFQLSFATVLGMGALMPEPLETPDEPNSRLRSWLLQAKPAFLVSFTAFLSTAPLLAQVFYMVSPVSIIANLAMVPYFGLVMASSLILLGFGGLHPKLLEALAASAEICAHFFITLSNFFARLPGGSFRMAPPSAFETSAFYAACFIWSLRGVLKIRAVHCGILALVLVNFFLWKRALAPLPSTLTATFLDVGHGDAALLQFPGGGTLLIDAGDAEDRGAGLGGSDSGRNVISPFLWRQGITRLDGVLITHPHLDHYGGLGYLLKEFEVGTVFDNGERSSGLYEKMIRDAKVRRIGLKQGDAILGVPGVHLRVKHPAPENLEDIAFGTNDRSVVLQVMLRNVRLLFTGDIEAEALEEIAARDSGLKSLVLKVQHHGSDEKESAARFQERVQPKIAVISEARENRFNLPGPAQVARLKEGGAQVYQTGISGAVRFETDGLGFQLSTMRNP